MQTSTDYDDVNSISDINLGGGERGGANTAL